jgi:hypothetical protein
MYSHENATCRTALFLIQEDYSHQPFQTRLETLFWSAATIGHLNDISFAVEMMPKDSSAVFAWVFLF